MTARSTPRQTLPNVNVLALSLLLVAGVSPGCSDSPEAAKAKKEAGEAVDALGDLFGKKQEDLVASFKDSLAFCEGEIQRLKEDAKAKGAELSDEASALIGALEERAAATKESLSKLNENKEDVWLSLARGTKNSLEELRKAITEAREAASK